MLARVLLTLFFSLTTAHWSAGEINDRVIEGTNEASYRVRGSIRNVSGVKIPIFARHTQAHARADPIVGLARGGDQVRQCRESFLSLLDDLVALASLQTSLKTLDEALTVTNRRVNALEFVVMPNLAVTITYVTSELDEMEREDTFRIKKVKDVRARQLEEEEEKNRIADELAEEKDNAEPSSALAGFEKDEDDITDDLF